ncbi:MAG: DUF1003 domain-containing protein [Nitrososphaerota archaeon]
MLKSVTPIWERLRHLRRPQMFLVRTNSPHVRGTAIAEGEPVTVGQRLAERVAAFVGSWWFLGGQACFLFLWLIYNTLQITRHFDPPPYILLNLLLSFQAAFTGPVLLIAANVGAVRDHQQSDRIERLAQQNEQLTEQNEQLAQRLLHMGEVLDRHVVQSLRAHSAEIQNLGTLLREVHVAVHATSTLVEAAEDASPAAHAAPPDASPTS